MSRFIVTCMTFVCLTLFAASTAGAVNPTNTQHRILLAQAGADNPYQQGQQAIDRGDYDKAIEIYDGLTGENEKNADAALYWKAYAYSKKFRYLEAEQTLAELLHRYPKSTWIRDARVLQRGIKANLRAKPARDRQAERARRGGRDERLNHPGSDDELKAIALESLIMVDEERALPVLKRFLAGNHSVELKRRALFILSQTGSSEAKQIVLDFAKSESNPELQQEALRVLGISGDEDSISALAEIYRNTDNPELKVQILHNLMTSGDPDVLIEVAENEKNTELRLIAINLLGAMGETTYLRRMYETERSTEAKIQIINALGVAGDFETLREVARNSTNTEVQLIAINMLGLDSSEENGEVLVGYYRESDNREVKGACLNALMVQGNAQALISLFEAERNPELKRQILDYATMTDPERATDLLIQILDE